MDEQAVLTTIENRVMTITFNRPDQLNALNKPLFDQYLDVLDEADQNEEVRIVIITGAGKGFCAGMDLSSGASTFDPKGWDPNSVKPPQERDGGGKLALKLFNLRKPVIAAINGAAVGIGATMLLPMDIRLASTHAKFSFPFTKRAIVAESCSSYFLPRLVGIAQAQEWILTARLFDANEAQRGGLVSQVLPPDDLLPHAMSLAREIADNTSAVSVALNRQQLWKGLTYQHPIEANRIESKNLFYMGKSPDVAEGITSFLEKRSPEFTMQVNQDLPDYYPWWDEPEF